MDHDHRQAHLLRWLNRRFSLLLCSILVLFLLSGFLEADQAGTLILHGLLGCFMVSCPWSLRHDRRSFWMSIAIAIPTLAIHLMIVSRVWHPSWLILLRDLMMAVFVGHTLLVILSYVFREKNVTTDTLAAATCVYFLIGIQWGFLYGAVEIWHPNSFRNQNPAIEATMSTKHLFGKENFSELMYFSFTSLTTSTYGDLTPLSRPARTLCFLEAIVGQLYMAVLVARLVGLHLK